MKFAEVFPPGEFLKEELEARNWTQVELAEVIGRPAKMVSEIILGKRAITPETAIQLGEALGTGPEFWMNLESHYQLSKVEPKEQGVSRKAKLYERFPVREMVRRGWIQTAESVDVLERQFLTYFGLQDIDQPISFPHAAKASCETNPVQFAWLFACHKLARRIVAPAFSADALRSSLPKLQALMSAPEEVRHVPRLLNECGVRFVIVEPLPSSLIDGACFWLSDDRPAIALSTRLDRIDNFWFVLRHEIEHVLQGHGKNEAFICDEDILGSPSDEKSESERIADEAAANFGVSRAALDDYVARVKPYYFSEQKLLNFAARLRVHPGIVLGRLQFRFSKNDKNVWRYLRHLLVKTRDIVNQSAFHDGWGTSTVVETNRAN